MNNNSNYVNLFNELNKYSTICEISDLKKKLELIKTGLKYELYFLGPAQKYELIKKLGDKHIAHIYIKIILDNCFITLGLSMDFDCNYDSRMMEYTGVKINIPDWSIKHCAKSDIPCFGYNKKNANDPDELAQGKLFESGFLNEDQMLLVKYLIKNSKKFNNDYRVKLPFLYAMIPNKISKPLRIGSKYQFINCREFAKWFHKYPQWLYNTIIKNDEINYPYKTSKDTSSCMINHEPIIASDEGTIAEKEENIPLNNNEENFKSPINIWSKPMNKRTESIKDNYVNLDLPTNVWLKPIKGGNTKKLKKTKKQKTKNKKQKTKNKKQKIKKNFIL